MRSFWNLFIVLAAFATAYARNYPDNSTTALQMLSFLNRLEVPVLEQLAARTNSTIFRQAYQVSGFSYESCDLY